MTEDQKAEAVLEQLAGIEHPPHWLYEPVANTLASIVAVVILAVPVVVTFGTMRLLVRLIDGWIK